MTVKRRYRRAAHLLAPQQESALVLLVLGQGWRIKAANKTVGLVFPNFSFVEVQHETLKQEHILLVTGIKR